MEEEKEDILDDSEEEVSEEVFAGPGGRVCPSDPAEASQCDSCQ